MSAPVDETESMLHYFNQLSGDARLVALGSNATGLGLRLSVKRMIDIALAASGLLLMSPLFVIVAMAVKLTTGGPVFSRERWWDHYGEQIELLRFGSSSNLYPANMRVGRVLRHAGLETLPWLLCVLSGDLSIVGPRPRAMRPESARETVGATHDARVRPGLTGWAQANMQGEERDTPESLTRESAFDRYYIDNRRLALDLKIMLMTARAPQSYLNAPPYNGGGRQGAP
jgi:polysaccharide biosynthesis protein PslA